MEKSKVVLRGVTRESLAGAVRECMERCGWEALVPKGARVVVKPNLCTTVPDKMEMSNTDAGLATAVCEVLAGRAGEIQIVESDHLRQTADEAFRINGYEEVARRVGARLVNLTRSPWVRVRCEPAGEIGLPRPMLEADVFVTLPVLKTHALTYFTGTLKNQWGCVPQHDRIVLHRYIEELLGTLHGMFRPALAVMDGIVGMEGRGPVNGQPRRLDVILASRDGVALDATAMRLVGLEPERARHIAAAAAMGLGKMAAEEIEVDGDWARHATEFEPAVLDRAVAAMNYMSRYRWFVKYALEKDLVFQTGRAAVQALRRVGVIRGGHQAA